MKIVRQSPKKWELYDLANDPSELNNLINDEPERFKSLLEGWEKIDSRMVKHLFKRIQFLHMKHRLNLNIVPTLDSYLLPIQ